MDDHDAGRDARPQETSRERPGNVILVGAAAMAYGAIAAVNVLGPPAEQIAAAFVDGRDNYLVMRHSGFRSANRT